jgi:hypothetical protein
VDDGGGGLFGGGLYDGLADVNGVKGFGEDRGEETDGDGL